MKKLAVIGDPVEHSLSPIIQNAVLKQLGLEKEFVFEKILVHSDELGKFMQDVRKNNITGLNVTIPHKLAIMKFLDKFSVGARLIGAVNTVVKKGEKLIGHNTDGIGCLNSLKEKGINIQGKKVVLLGAGGAARAIAFVLAQTDIQNLTIVNRTPEKTNELAKELIQKTKAKVISAGLENLKEILSNADILINATSVGMNSDETLVTSEQMHKNLVVLDIVYSPLKTKLLQEAEKAGAKIIDGLEMLIQQGAIAFELFTGKKAPAKVMRASLQDKLKLPNPDKMNLIVKKTGKLIGTVIAPPSKSHTHRAVIIASLASGTSRIKNPLLSEDCMASIKACGAMGAEITIENGDLIITGVSGKLHAPKKIIEIANLVTEFKEIKHPFKKGIMGRKGREY